MEKYFFIFFNLRCSLRPKHFHDGKGVVVGTRRVLFDLGRIWFVDFTNCPSHVFYDRPQVKKKTSWERFLTFGKEGSAARHYWRIKSPKVNREPRQTHSKAKHEWIRLFFLLQCRSSEEAQKFVSHQNRKNKDYKMRMCIPIEIFFACFIQVKTYRRQKSSWGMYKCRKKTIVMSGLITKRFSWLGTMYVPAQTYHCSFIHRLSKQMPLTVNNLGMLIHHLKAFIGFNWI